MANTYSTSYGDRLTTSQIDRLIRNAKKEKYYNLESRSCETCGRCDSRLDMSHLISVKECKESGRSEISYDIYNIILECTECHMKTERQSKLEREKRYYENKH